MVFVLRKPRIRTSTIGLTYAAKPAFIDRLIEVGSHHFVRALGRLSIAAAEAENGENIGMSKHALANAQEATWHIRKTIEPYTALVESVGALPVSDRAQKILSEFDYSGLKRTLARGRTTIEEEQQWTQFVEESKQGDPVGGIRSFLMEVKDVERSLSDVVGMLESGVMDAHVVHSALTAFIRAMTFGQYIAEFNRTSRERYAAA